MSMTELQTTIVFHIANDIKYSMFLWTGSEGKIVQSFVLFVFLNNLYLNI